MDSFLKKTDPFLSFRFGKERNQMSPLEKSVSYHYQTMNYNCAETLLAACNDTFELGLDPSSFVLLSGFGGGLFTGNTCGALCGCTAALATMLVKTKAHETPDLPTAQRILVRNFRNALQEVHCSQIKPLYHSKEKRCLNTCLKAAQAMNQTLIELKEKDIIYIDSNKIY